MVYLPFRYNKQHNDLTDHHALDPDPGSCHTLRMISEVISSESMRFAVIIALVCSKLVSDMYRFCFDPIIMLLR